MTSHINFTGHLGKPSGLVTLAAQLSMGSSSGRISWGRMTASPQPNSTLNYDPLLIQADALHILGSNLHSILADTKNQLAVTDFGLADNTASFIQKHFAPHLLNNEPLQHAVGEFLQAHDAPDGAQPTAEIRVDEFAQYTGQSRGILGATSVYLGFSAANLTIKIKESADDAAQEQHLVLELGFTISAWG